MNFPQSSEYAQIQGSPEGALDAGRGTLCTDIDTGRLFAKRTAGGLLSGWAYQPLTVVGVASDPNGSIPGWPGDSYVVVDGTRWTKILGDGTTTGWK